MFHFPVPDFFQNIVLLIVRIILAITFFYEARFKFRDIKGFAKNDGVPLPVAYLVATAELFAAISMLTGFLAQWAGVGLVVLMLCTIGMQIFRWHSPYWANKKGWEYDLIMLVLSAVIVVFGPGVIAVP
ncbi:MAG: DoxX family protein [Chitinophagaceae bacterium]|mgnify:CR=1 FL=1|nr:DoxX family protein [Chitinophagaceae bacterium]